MARRKAVQKRAFRFEADLPTPEQLNQAQYDRDFVTHAETNTKAMVYKNRGGSALCRWEAAGKLDDTQLAVISRCQEIWRLVGINQCVTANYGERVSPSNDVDGMTLSKLQAKEDLARFTGYFPGRSRDYFSVFENVIRHSVPAGIAGSVAGFDSKAATARSLTIVRMVCDVIASHEKL